MADGWFGHPHRVSYHECTLGDHVYYARYLDLMEAARGALFRAVGQPFRRWQEAGVLFPVVEVGVTYRGAARYDDLLLVRVRIEAMERVRLDFGYRIERAGEGLVTGRTRHVCTGLDGRPCRLPAELATALSGLQGESGGHG